MNPAPTISAPPRSPSDNSPVASLSVAVIGPSASGKSSVVRELARRGVVTVHPTWTTRPPRPDERHGSLEHRFVDEATFQSLGDRGFFQDTVEMFGLPHRYGLPPFTPASDGRVDLVMLRAPLVERFRSHVPHVVTYQIEGDEEQAQRWLVARGCQSEDVAARVRDNTAEVALGHQIAARTFRNDSTIEALADAIAVALDTDRGRNRP